MKYISSLQTLNGNKIKLCCDKSPNSWQILAKYYRDKNVQKYLSNLKIRSLSDSLFFLGCDENAERFFDETDGDLRTFKILNFKNEPVGVLKLDFWEQFNFFNISYWIAKPFWGNGYASEAAVTLIKNFYDNQIIVPINIAIELKNHKSLRCCEKIIQKLGFENFILNKKIERDFKSSTYHLKQKLVVKENKYIKKIDGNIVFLFNFDEKEISRVALEKNFFRRDLIRKGSIKVKSLQFLITPKIKKEGLNT